MRTLAFRAALVVALGLTAPPGDSRAADELHVMTSGAFTAAYLELAAAFERQEGHRLVTEATSMGTGTTSIEARLDRGEAIDVVIVDADSLDRFVQKDLVVAGSQTPLARSAIGMAVRRGAAKPDISTVDALTRTLLEASSIAYSASVSGTYLSKELFQQLGVADRVLPKSRRIEGERVGAVVARGEAEIGFQQISELMPVAGIDFVGPLPAPVQRVTVFSAGLGARARAKGTATRFIAFLASPAASATILEAALEPVTKP